MPATRMGSALNPGAAFRGLKPLGVLPARVVAKYKSGNEESLPKKATTLCVSDGEQRQEIQDCRATKT